MNFSMKFVKWLARRDWIRFGIRKRIVNWWCSSRNPDVSFEVDFLGSVYRGNLRDYIDRCVYFYGAYEKVSLILLRDLASTVEQSVFVGVGANGGQHSLWMARYCSPVYVFEPWAPMREHLIEKVRLNQFKHVSVFPVGLGDCNAEMPFYSPPDSDAGIGSFIDTYHAWNRNSGESLPIRAGDGFFAEHAIAPDIIKLDVEGFEAKVLAGLQQMLQQYKPAVLLEFSSTTRAQFGSLQGLLDMFPYPVEIRKIVPLSGLNYCLKEFSFDKVVIYLLGRLADEFQINQAQVGQP